MRRAFIDTLAGIAEEDSRVVFLTGDLGFTIVEDFAQRMPDRFFNVGVAEQNMVGLATGLAESGFVPFVYSIVTFASLRPYEFIRNGPILQNLPVRIVGVGGGFDYGFAGPTHFGLEDLGVMRVQPGITVVSPADHRQAASALAATWDLPGPVYYRLGKDENRVIPNLDGRFTLGRAEVVREGRDLLILTTGAISSEVVIAASELEAEGFSCEIVLVPTLNPAPTNDLIQKLRKFPAALTVEAHYVNGGLGSLVSEVIAEEGIPCRLVRCGVRDTPVGVIGSEEYMNDSFGLSAAALVKTARRAVEESETPHLQ